MDMRKIGDVMRVLKLSLILVNGGGISVELSEIYLERIRKIQQLLSWMFFAESPIGSNQNFKATDREATSFWMNFIGA